MSIREAIGKVTEISWLKKWLLMGFLCQSVLMAGGYATGRELVEFFMLNGGPRGMLIGMGFTTILFAVIAIVTFECARVLKVYDYMSFMKQMLPGKGYILFEIGYLVLILVISGIVASSAGEMLKEWLGVPYWVGITIILVIAPLVLYGGGKAVSGVLTWWSFALYGIITIYLIVAIKHFGFSIPASTIPKPIGLLRTSFAYAMYNSVTFMVVLYAVKDNIKTRTEAISKGIISAIIMMIPGFFIALTLVSHYPAILEAPVPIFDVILKLGKPLMIAYVIVMFGTFIETMIGFVHGFNERINASYEKAKGQNMPGWLRGTIGLVLLGGCIPLTKIGVIGLVARGYSFLNWWFLATYIIPTFVVGIARLKGKNPFKVN